GRNNGMMLLTSLSFTTDFGKLNFLCFILFANVAYSSTPHASILSFNVGTMSEVMTRESVRGYVNTLYRSYNCCMARKVCFPEKPKIRFASRCNSVKSYNCGAN